MGSHSDPSGRSLPPSRFSDSQPLPAAYTDVSVVPEHEKQELERTIANLEGSVRDSFSFLGITTFFPE